MAGVTRANSAGIDTIARLVERAALEDSLRPALMAPGRQPVDYGALNRLLGSVAAQTNERGLEAHDRVALVVENGPEAATAFLALAAAATCALSTRPIAGWSSISTSMISKPRAVVVSRRLVSPVREAAADRGITVLELDVDLEAPSGTFALDGPSFGAPLVHSSALGDIALLLHTSGTTSQPKLVPLTHRNLLTSARHVAATLALRPDDRCLNVMPLFHIHGLVAALLASLDAGASVVCTPGFHQIRLFDWLADTKPTWLTAVPTMHRAVLARRADHEDVLLNHRLRFLRSSSAALPVPVLEQLEETFGVPVIEAYGMTEAAHQMASNPLPPAVRKPGSVGCASGPEIAVLALDGEPVSNGTVGEVVIRGGSVFAGTSRTPKRTRRHSSTVGSERATRSARRRRLLDASRWTQGDQPWRREDLAARGRCAIARAPRRCRRRDVRSARRETGEDVAAAVSWSPASMLPRRLCRTSSPRRWHRSRFPAGSSS